MILALEDVSGWTASADLIVVGYGIAGVCGAIEAREAGADVLVLERSSGCTGSTAVASGHFYLGGGTAVQTACGFSDSAEAVANYLTAVSDRPDKAKFDAFAAGGVALFDWLEARGVPFDRSYFPTKAVIQYGRDCLIWTGNEKVWPYRDEAAPAPRGHKVAFEGEEGGGALALRKLVEHAERIGVDTRFDMQVDALVMDAGRIVGVRARHFGERLFFRAERGVLLAGGGFGRNEAMMAHYLPRFDGVTILGGPYDDGTAINLGMDAGGAVDNMDGILVTSPIYPPEQLVKGILVNRDGKRFVAEDSYHSRTTLAIIEQPDGEAYLIVDSDIFAYPAWTEHANQRLVDGFA
ncbi:MAG: FAD-binding protein, partial [Sphingomonadales bacterium]